MKLAPTAIVLGPEAAFVLAHPTTRGKVDLDRTLVFEVQNDEAVLLRDFELEVTGIAHVSGELFAVDADANLHRFAKGNGRIGMTSARAYRASTRSARSERAFMA